MVTQQRLKCRPPMGGRITRVDVDTRVEAPRRARNGERDATSLGSRKPLAQSTCRCSARGSLWRKAAGLARRGERRAERPARLEEACGARQRARMRGKGRAGDEKIVSVAHLRMPRRSAAHLRMPRGGLAMLIRLPRSRRSRKPAAQGRRLASVRASLRRRAAGRRRSERRSRPSVAPSDSNPFKSRHRRAGLPDARSTKVIFFCHCRGRQRPEAVAADAPPCIPAEKLESEASRGLSTPLDTATFCLCDTPNNHLPGLGTPQRAYHIYQ